MENITLGDLSKMMLFAVSFIGAIEFLALRMRKYILITVKEELKPIKDNQINHDKILNQMELQIDKNYLVRFLADIENGTPVDETELEHFWFTYDDYHKNNGNSYIDHKVEKLKKEGKL